MGLQCFYVCPHCPVDHIRVFCSFRFSSRRSLSQQNLAKKITHFTIQFHSKKPHSFNKTQPIWHWKIMLPQHSQKHFPFFPTFPNFPASMWLVSEKHLHRIICRHPKTAFLKQLESKCLYISIYLCEKIFVPEICWGAEGWGVGRGS